MARLQLILGGARSGKSRLGEQVASKYSSVTYIATAQAHDNEMVQRITRHQKDRPKAWLLIEEPIFLTKAIQQALTSSDCVLVDCLTLWLTNCLCDKNAGCWQEQKQILMAYLNQLSALALTGKKIILISNEVGHGIVPLGQLSRDFVDQAGWLHQALGVIANKVDFVIAGIPLNLKEELST